MTTSTFTPPVRHPRLAGRWRIVAARSYGTRVYRVDGARTYYVKTTPPRPVDDFRSHPASEAARLTWLRDRGFPVPGVVDVGGDEELAWLVTTALPGVPASAGWTSEQRRRVRWTVADLTRSLHALPVADCPFDRSLSVSLDWARRATEQGLVDLDDLNPTHRGWSAERLLAELTATPAPSEDLVVCHGDLYLDNVLVDPDTQKLTGILDVGRLGLADRWRDLAIVLRCLDGDHDAEFLVRYGARPDERRARYYLLLDEFF
jgi:aminoglycoside phosphotransferase